MTQRVAFPTAVDNTMINSFRACAQQFYWNYIRRKEPNTRNINLHAGGAFAHALEQARKAFYVGHLTQEQAEVVGLRALWQFFGSVETDEVKSWDRMAGALVSYFDEYPFGGDTIQPTDTAAGPAIEFTFAVPIEDTKHPETGLPILYTGRCDMIGSYRDLNWTVDEKTTKQLGPTWPHKWGLRAQFMGYNWASGELLGIKCEGTIIRGICIRKTGYDHAQAMVYHPPWMIARWHKQMTITVKHMIQSWERNEWELNLGDTCSSFAGCPFTRLCEAENPEVWLEGYYQTNTWDPLHKTPDTWRLPDADEVPEHGKAPQL